MLSYQEFINESIQHINEKYVIFKKGAEYEEITSFCKRNKPEIFSSIVTTLGLDGFTKVLKKLASTSYEKEDVINSIKNIEHEQAEDFVYWLTTCYNIYYSNENEMESSKNRLTPTQYHLILPVGKSYIEMFPKDIVLKNKRIQSLADVIFTDLGLTRGW